jgi:hypothetical protein
MRTLLWHKHISPSQSEGSGEALIIEVLLYVSAQAISLSYAVLKVKKK